MSKHYYTKCDFDDCETFKVKVVFLTEYATDTQHICTECGRMVSGVINDPFDELNEDGTVKEV